MMTSKTRRSKYKGVKWINSRYSKPYRIRMWLKRVQACLIISQSLSKISMIRSASFSGAAARVSKASAIAEAVTGAVSAVNSISWNDAAPKSKVEIFVSDAGEIIGSKSEGFTYFSRSTNQQSHS